MRLLGVTTLLNLEGVDVGVVSDGDRVFVSESHGGVIKVAV